jgi:hypothetical protein
MGWDAALGTLTGLTIFGIAYFIARIRRMLNEDIAERDAALAEMRKDDPDGLD